MENSTTTQNNADEIISQGPTENQEVDISAVAIKKLQAEFATFKGGNKEKAVSSYVSNILQDFCKQDKRFADVVFRFKRTLSDCCKEIMKNVGQHISDIDVYRHAVQFYFPNSEIAMSMTISITGEAPSEEEITKEAPKEQLKPKKQTKAKPNTTKSQEKPKTTPKKQDEFIQLSLI